jgi:hypothetical protein
MYYTQIICVKSRFFWSGAVLISLLLLVQACSPLTPNGSYEITETPANQQPEPMESPVIQQPEQAVTPAIQEPESSEPPTNEPTPAERELRPIIRTPEWVPIPPGEPGQPVTGETPASLLEDILADVVERTGVAREAVVIIRDQAVMWSDGSLGCPQPGVFYTQALVPGYRVVLQVSEVEYDYRASERGYFLLCQGGAPPFQQPVDR